METTGDTNLNTGKFNHESLIKNLSDVKGSIPDIQPEPFLQTMNEFVKIFQVIGSAIAFAFKDITSKVAIIKANYNTFPEVQGGLIKFIEHEERLKLQRLNGDNPKEAPDPKYKKYESTTRTVLRLMWFFDFMTVLLNNMSSDRTAKISDCCKKAYDEALGPHHPLAVRMGAKTAMTFAPGRDKFFKELFPEGMSEEAKYATFKQAVDLIAPTREFLWKYYTDHNLKELP